MYQGDLSPDDLVDFGDYVVWEGIYLSETPYGVQAADLNGDGLVDFGDYIIWESTYLAGIFGYYPY
jgi:hypothetical protein